jgi:uncharacterized protein YaiI (UPF0178 family)
LDLQRIVAELEQERDRLTQAINLLKQIESTTAIRKVAATARSSRTAQKPRGNLTPEGRKRISEAMKKRWAERSKKDK